MHPVFGHVLSKNFVTEMSNKEEYVEVVDD